MDSAFLGPLWPLQYILRDPFHCPSLLLSLESSFNSILKDGTLVEKRRKSKGQMPQLLFLGKESTPNLGVAPTQEPVFFFFFFKLDAKVFFR